MIRGLSTITALIAVRVLVSCGGADPPPSDRYERQTTTWSVIGLSRDQRTLSVRYVVGGSCGRDDGRADPQETADAVALRVTRSVLVESASETVCTANLFFETLRVRLRAPLAGRRIDGGAVQAAGANQAIMPNLVGFDIADALDLASQVSPRIAIVSGKQGRRRAEPASGPSGDPALGVGRGIRQVRIRLSSP